MQPASLHERHSIDGIYYKYYFAGSGAQFRVYAIYTHDGRSTGRVVKVPLDLLETKQAIFEPLRQLHPELSDDTLDERADVRAQEVMNLKYDVPRLIQGVLGDDKPFRRKIGNLRMLQVPIPAADSTIGAYYLPTLFTQDYVVTLDEYFQQFRMASNPYMRTLELKAVHQLKKVIDQIVALHFSIWEYGLFEFVFKPENFGIRFNARGGLQLIWIDLAEHITDLSAAETIIAERRWRHATMTHKVDYQFMPIILQEYYIEVCDRMLTIDNLHKYWRRKSEQIERSQVRKLRVKELLSTDDKKTVRHWISRHTLSQTLYQGFRPETIDDMQLPISDIEALISDRHYADNEKKVSIEERVERRMSLRDEPVQNVFPLVIPLFSQKEDRL